MKSYRSRLNYRSINFTIRVRLRTTETRVRETSKKLNTTRHNEVEQYGEYLNVQSR